MDFIEMNNERYNNNNNNNSKKRISNGSNPNNYLITIPRCDLPKKYVFDGLVNICHRLAVSKEKHKLTYLDACCKNSSIRKTSASNSNRSNSSTLITSTCNNNINNPNNSSINLHAEQARSSSTTRENSRSQDYLTSEQQIQDICNGIVSRHQDICQYKRRKTTQLGDDELDEASIVSSTQTQTSTTSTTTTHNTSIALSISSFLSDSFLNDSENENWIHCNSHIHIYAEFYSEHIVDFDKCKRIMEWCTSGYNSNIEKCKTPKNAIIYVTKEDDKPLLKNINPDEVSFHKKMMDWIKLNPEFNYYDPFICSRPNFYKFIVLAHTNYYKKNPIQISPCHGLKVSNLDCNNNQTKIRVQQWFNECVLNWHLKFPALYLWGASNTGKTTIIFDWLLASQVTENQIYRPARNCQFAWADFTSSQHLVVVMDEFDFSQFDIEEWKNIVEGRFTSVRVKGRSAKTIALRCPIIIVSNHQPPTDKPEILNRIRIIKTEVLTNRLLF